VLLNELKGRQVTFQVSDPWDFGTEHGVGPFPASIEAASQQGLLLQLAKPLVYKGLPFRFVVATPRHEDSPLEAIADQKVVPTNLTPVPETAGEGSHSESMFEAAAHWRGWHLIGAIRAS
jgi:hypothetical protein